jgi:hypothetical protein
LPLAYDMAQRVPVDFNPGFAPLIQQLTDDSKKLLGDEVRLAKLETIENLHHAARGGLWFSAALGVLIVGLVAATLLLATLIGRLVEGHYWVGALVTAMVELVAGYWLLARGLKEYKRAPYSLPETREGIKLLKG